MNLKKHTDYMSTKTLYCIILISLCCPEVEVHTCILTRQKVRKSVLNSRSVWLQWALCLQNQIKTKVLFYSCCPSYCTDGKTKVQS